MRVTILLFLFAAAVPALALYPNPNAPKSGKVSAASNNVPTAFDTTAGSKILSTLGGKKYSHLKCENETSTRIAVITVQGTSAPSSTSTALFYVPANNFRILDDVTVLDTVFIQSDGSAISTGTVECEVW